MCRTWLVKKDAEGNLREVNPEEILPKVIFRVEADAIILHTFPKRDQLWKRVRSFKALCELMTLDHWVHKAVQGS